MPPFKRFFSLSSKEKSQETKGRKRIVGGAESTEGKARTFHMEGMDEADTETRVEVENEDLEACRSACVYSGQVRGREEEREEERDRIPEEANPQ